MQEDNSITPARGPARNTTEAAKRLGSTPNQMAHLRWKGEGPPYHKLGRRVVYFDADLDEYLDRHRVEPKGERGAA